MTIIADSQRLDPGRRIELFDFDATSLGGGTFFWISGFQEPLAVSWRGNSYTPLPISAEGFVTSGAGSQPTPTVTISNVLLLPATIINSLGDPLGAKLTRWVTLATYLDDGATPDPNQHYVPQIFVVERKTEQNKLSVAFELSSSLDQEGRMLPGRQILRDTCTHRYRLYNAETGTFDYTRATCPYVGSDDVPGGVEAPFFTPNGSSTADPSADSCGKKVRDCRLRFEEKPLPYRGFPGVSRIRGT
ncbi:MAG: phage minor tail protein L [Gammaproteobacteria bacterium]|nr:phage minor tail protein L [Gammaproteobacteria bacterium]